MDAYFSICNNDQRYLFLERHTDFSEAFLKLGFRSLMRLKASDTGGIWPYEKRLTPRYFIPPQSGPMGVLKRLLRNGSTSCLRCLQASAHLFVASLSRIRLVSTYISESLIEARRSGPFAAGSQTTEAPTDNSEYAVYSSSPTSRWSSYFFAPRSFLEILSLFVLRYSENSLDLLAHPLMNSESLGSKSFSPI